jgi:hypothetical protein
MTMIGFPVPVKRTETVVRTMLPAPVRYPGMASDAGGSSRTRA